ncbi:type 1 glycerol-3-phosphate oxidase [Lacticaseibacillus sp. GG6-2]
MTFSAKTRPATINQLQSQTLDLLVIGGGITGAGVALQAAASGLVVGLIEMQDFAEGTSSRSTKLVHGGIRYLKTFDVGVVADTVQERAIVHNIAPHIPQPAPMLLPIYAEPGATFDMFSIKVAMDLYDRLADITRTQYANYMLDRDAVLAREPGLDAQNLKGGGVYLDYVNNDSRLVIENIKEADELGALIVSHVEAVNILHDATGQATGVQVHDHLNGGEFTINSRLIINTTGPWSDSLRERDEALKVAPQMRPTKGVHLVVDDSVLFVSQPTYFDSGLQDGRMIFVVPREGKTYFGTTDTDYHGDFAHPRVDRADVDYLLAVINRRYPTADVTLDNIEASWAGLRPLIDNNAGSDYSGGSNQPFSTASVDKVIDVVARYEGGTASRQDVEKVLKDLQPVHAEAAPSTISRGSTLEVEDDGMLTLAGGKLTDYRKMATGAMTLIRRLLLSKHGVHSSQIDAARLQVSGGHFDANTVAESLRYFARLAEDIGVPHADAVDLAARYGSNTGRVLTYATDGAASGLSLKETISLRYSVDQEMTLTPVDYLLRRTNLLLFHAQEVSNLAGPIVAEMGKLLDWDDDTQHAQMQLVEEAISESALHALKASQVAEGGSHHE